MVFARFGAIPFAWALVGIVAALAAWGTARHSRSPWLSLIYLALACTAGGALYYHWRLDLYPADDIGNFAAEQPGPVIARAMVREEPSVVTLEHDSFRTFDRADPMEFTVRVTQIRDDQDWLPVTGLCEVVVPDRLRGIHAGDEVEIVGRLALPADAHNPGEFSPRHYLHDRGIRAEIHVLKTVQGVTRLAAGSPWDCRRVLPFLRGFGERVLDRRLPKEIASVAKALLLGETNFMSKGEWEKYVRTGVVHILAISGQHLMILGFCLGWLFRLLGVSRSWSVAIIAFFLLGYALLAGGRPPVLRAAVTTCVACGAYYLRRPIIGANVLALAWLIVSLVNPADVFTDGCQISFLAVAVLYFGVRRWPRREVDPLVKLIEESRPRWQQISLAVLRWIGRIYLITVVLWATSLPLVVSKYHLTSVVGLLIGPPVILLSTIALTSGFFLLATAWCPPIAALAALVLRASLGLCALFVRFCDGIPGSHWYLGDVPAWWCWGFYAILFAALTSDFQRFWRPAVLLQTAWLCLGLLLGFVHSTADELRCTFLAVGHGGCVVIETPGGRTLLYDAGSMLGPDVGRRQIAPFLWSRGISRIDELFLSHADLDHYNAVASLLERFAVGQVSCNPTFAEKEVSAIGLTLSDVGRRHIPVRTLCAGDHLVADDVQIDVLHPPMSGPEGNENARSLVLLVRHAGHSVLLTGDLEGAGLERVLARSAPDVDVLMAPHHGSRVSNTPQLAAWAHAKLVISCEGRPRGLRRGPEPYTAAGARFLGTFPHGAVTLHSHASGLTLETFVTKERMIVQRGGT